MKITKCALQLLVFHSFNASNQMVALKGSLLRSNTALPVRAQTPRQLNVPRRALVSRVQASSTESNVGKCGVK